MVTAAGKFRHRVEVQDPVERADANKALRVIWTTVAVRWASVTPLSGSERTEGQHIKGTLTHEVRMRHFRGMSPRRRLVYRGRVLEIDSVHSEGEANTETVCMCKEATEASADMDQLDGGVLTLNPICGRPAETTALLRCVSPVEVEAYYTWGSTAQCLDGSTTATVYRPFVSIDASVTGLSANTLYYWTFYYRRPDGADWTEASGSFYTTPTAGTSGYHMCLVADRHSWQDYTTPTDADLELDKHAMAAIAANSPRLIFDLGDTFHSECYTEWNAACERESLRRHMLSMGRWGDNLSTAHYIQVLGNHEAEQGWRYSQHGEDLPAWARDARQTIIPNPAAPDSVTSDFGGDADSDGQNCGVFEYGNVQFIWLDPYTYTTTQVHNKDGHEGSGDNWDWTLGVDQYAWLRGLMQTASTKWRVVLIHQIVGGHNTYGRGGIKVAKYSVDNAASYEWGGEDDAGRDVFATKRPDFAAETPIHDLLVAGGVDVVFFGHDHVGVKETLDGIIYHHIGKPNDSTYGEGFWSQGDYDEDNGTKIPNSHYVRLTQYGTSYLRIATIAVVRDGDSPSHGYADGEVMNTYDVS